jgi:hypothetical protein
MSRNTVPMIEELLSNERVGGQDLMKIIVSQFNLTLSHRFIGSCVAMRKNVFAHPKNGVEGAEIVRRVSQRRFGQL